MRDVAATYQDGLEQVTEGIGVLLNAACKRQEEALQAFRARNAEGSDRVTNLFLLLLINKPFSDRQLNDNLRRALEGERTGLG